MLEKAGAARYALPGCRLGYRSPLLLGEAFGSTEVTSPIVTQDEGDGVSHTSRQEYKLGIDKALEGFNDTVIDQVPPCVDKGCKESPA